LTLTIIVAVNGFPRCSTLHRPVRRDGISIALYLPMVWMPERELTNDRRISDDPGERAHPAESADSRHGSSPQASDLDPLLSIDDFDLLKSLHIAGR
jgi:hypothetical protein